jgi:hypothetical protein
MAAHIGNYRNVGAVVPETGAENTFVTRFQHGGINRGVS